MFAGEEIFVGNFEFTNVKRDISWIHALAWLRPRIWPFFLASSGVPSATSGQAHPATYRSGKPRLRSRISDFRSRIFDYKWWYRTRLFRFRHLHSCSHKLLANFYSAFRNPHSTIVGPLARRLAWAGRHAHLRGLATVIHQTFGQASYRLSEWLFITEIIFFPC